jgi:protein CpxP
MNNKTKFLTIIIVALLLMNAGTLTFMFMRMKPPHDRGPREVSKWLTGQLNLDAGQQEQFNKLQEAHKQNMEPIQQQDRDLHDRYFKLLHGDVTDSTLVKQLADSIALNRVQTELVTFYDFKKIRGICNPEQQKKFDEIIGEALRMMAPHGPRPPKE